jgi:putative addiction module CopG family antidote
MRHSRKVDGEEFVRQKVVNGDYETASEVVREGLRLLKQRDEVWKADVRDKSSKVWIQSARVAPTAADQLEDDIYAACELLAKNSRLGHRRSDLTDEPVLRCGRNTW